MSDIDPAPSEGLGNTGIMRIAVLDDDDVHAETVKSIVERMGHSCTTVSSAGAMMALLRRSTFDLLILDWMLPESSGLEVVRWVRRNISPAPPILMVTAKVEEADIVEGLEAGADDYITKPISELVLRARLIALLRRAYPHAQSDDTETFGPYVFHMVEKTVRLSGAVLPLTDKEFGLGLLLFRNANRALSRKYILDSIWGWNSDLSSRTLDMHISRVRSKLALKPENGYKIGSIYSYGYRLERIDK